MTRARARWYPIVGALLLALSNAWAASAEPVELRSGALSVSLDPAFPRILRYRLGEAVLEGQAADAGRRVELNGKPAECSVTLRRVDARAAEYRLTFAEPRAEVVLRVGVEPDFVEWKASAGAGVETLALPDSAWVTIRGAQADAEIAFAYATAFEPPTLQRSRERVGPLKDGKSGDDAGNYFFGAAGGVAFGLGGNHFTDCERVAYRIAGDGDARTCAVRNPVWAFRAEGEALPEPMFRIFVAGDRNGDGRATWQDAAVAYRAHMPKPFGAEFVRTTVADQIAMNFASAAQQPFLRILDNIKKGYLATDGIGQQVLIKGFSTEGHDSANTDCGGNYNVRAGGLRDLAFLEHEAKRYNARIGIHINASEVYPEAQRYHADILRKTAKGDLEHGWQWLDQAIMIDKVKDTTSGRLFASLDLMRREQPDLDFVYVDTYWTHGWTAWKLAEKMRALRLPMYTEGDAALDPWTTWAHWRGTPSQVMRFLWYSDRDVFNNDEILRGGRSDADGFMGWQNHHSFATFVQGTFGRNLPAKFLKHFELLRWAPGKEAQLSGGVRVAKDGERVTCTQSGRVVMTWTGGGSTQRLFVPWDPIVAPKIYLWDEVGGSNRWQLPPAWAAVKEVCVYRLTDLGRAEEQRVPVADGWVTLSPEKGVPYVVYPKPAPRNPALVWGEGGPVADPGFDSHTLSAWRVAAAGEPGARVENDARGNSRLLIDGASAIRLEQSLTGLEPGRRYVASVWVQVAGRRLAALEVSPAAGPAASNYVLRTSVRHAMPNDPRTGSNYQRLKVPFTMPAGARAARLALVADAGGAGTAVEFDDVRIVAVGMAPEAAKHWFWEDFENVDQGYGPFTCCPGERTHLAEAHAPYTEDTINGRFSLKTREGNGQYVRTLPCTIRFKPLTRYRLACQTLTAAGGKGRFVVTSKGARVFDQAIASGRGVVTGEFATARDEDSYLSLFKEGGDWISVDDLAIDELGPAPETAAAPAVDDLAGRVVVLDERFAGPLSAGWRVIASTNPATRVTASGGVLTIEAAANTSALIERDLAADVGAVECRMTFDSAGGETWGPGVALAWAGGPAIRLNVRPQDNRFAIDAQPGGQRITSVALPGNEVVLRIRLEPGQLVLDARAPDAADWMEVGQYPRASFPGRPRVLRVGKMHGVEGTDDHSAPGAVGTTEVLGVRVAGPRS